MQDLVGQIMAYEDGELNDLAAVELFAALVASGMAWQLQGAYGRQAVALIDGGFITAEGEVTERAYEVLS